MAHVIDPFVYVAYLSDDTTTYTAKMRASVQTALGYTAVAESAFPKWVRPHRDMRKIYGKNAASPFNSITFVEVAVGSARFQGVTNTVTWRDGATYNLLGRDGEKRMFRG